MIRNNILALICSIIAWPLLFIISTFLGKLYICGEIVYVLIYVTLFFAIGFFLCRKLETRIKNLLSVSFVSVFPVISCVSVFKFPEFEAFNFMNTAIGLPAFPIIGLLENMGIYDHRKILLAYFVPVLNSFLIWWGLETKKERKVVYQKVEDTLELLNIPVEIPDITKKKYCVLILKRSLSGMLGGLSICVPLFVLYEVLGIGVNPITAIITMILILVVSFLYFAYKFTIPSKLMMKGDFYKSIKISIALLEEYKKRDKARNSLFYNIAGVYYRLGYFERSIEWLDKMDTDTCDINLKWAYHSLYGINLLMLEKYNEDMEKHLRISSELGMVEFNPVKAFRATIMGEFEDAVKFVNEYLEKKKKTKYLMNFAGTSLIFDQYTYEVENNFFIGITYQRMGDIDKARVFLEKASQWKFETFITKKAKDILKELEEARNEEND